MFTIGEVASRTGIAASAIRYYEREGLVPKADRRGGRRIYGEDILDRLEARSAELERMKRVLEAVTRCACPTLEECSRALRK